VTPPGTAVLGTTTNRPTTAVLGETFTRPAAVSAVTAGTLPFTGAPPELDSTVLGGLGALFTGLLLLASGRRRKVNRRRT
jgi:hypothetical protein